MDIQVRKAEESTKVEKAQIRLEVLSSVAGAKADSLYQIAVRNGYQGTEQDFLNEYVYNNGSGFYNLDSMKPLTGSNYTLATAVAAVAADSTITAAHRNGMIIQFYTGTAWQYYAYQLTYTTGSAAEQTQFADTSNWSLLIETVDISGKADKVSGAEAGHLAGLDASGNLTDSGFGVDNTPTEDSTNLVKSGGVWSWVTGLIASVKEWATNLFAKKDGWYKRLVAGAAENIVGQTVVEAEYTFRKSDNNAGSGTAQIDTLKGKTLKWNQKSNFTTQTLHDITLTNNQDGTYTLSGVNDGNGTSDFFMLLATISPAGHKLYLKVRNLDYNAETSKGTYLYCSINEFNSKYVDYSGIAENFASGSIDIIVTRGTDYTTPLKISLIIIDLTEMFGAGNEPSTAAEFEALYPLDYYAYTSTPVLINNAASGIKTTGFNQWDEQWENGSISTTGVKEPNASNFRTKNYIRIFPSTDYFVKTPTTTGLRFYDINKGFLGQSTNKVVGSGNTRLITTPANAYYMMFVVIGQSAYNNNICINLSWSGYRNGEYEPYEEHTLYFNGESGSLATITGKKLVDGVPTGESVTIFPEGMKSAGSVYDFGKADSDGYIRKVTKRIGSVNLGTLYYSYNTTYGFYTTLPTAKRPSAGNVSANLICQNRIATNYIAMYAAGINGAYIGLGSDGYLGINSTLTNATAFKSSMSGVYLYYELDTPEEYLLDTPIPANYIFNNYGTEARLPSDTSSTVKAPAKYSVKYALNAADIIRNLGVNYIKKESMDHILTAFKTAGVISNYTLTYNAASDDYSCTITA